MIISIAKTILNKKEKNRVEKYGTTRARVEFDCDALKSPEMLIRPGKINIEFSSDYWSLGLLVYQMLTGRLPFNDINSILNDEIPNLQELAISNEAKQFVSSLLIKDQFKRLGSMKNEANVKQDPFFNEIN